MIIGTGMDLVSVERFAAFLRRRGEAGLRRLFTPAELEYCRPLALPTPSLAARFAAKEAFLKALGTGLAGGLRWTEVEVVRAPSGQPSLRLHGGAAAAAARRGAGRFHLSISHTEQLAGAVVVLEE